MGWGESEGREGEKRGEERGGEGWGEGSGVGGEGATSSYCQLLGGMTTDDD